MQPYDIYNVSLPDLVRAAWAMKPEFNLRNIGYGQIHRGMLREILKSPEAYYFFLAGLTRLTGARHIVEVGTHQGGSARAMAKGFANAAESKIVTFDVTKDGVDMFSRDPVIKPYQLNANTREAVEACINEFGRPRSDMVFIDSTHDFSTTMQSFAIYSSLIQSPIIVLDDITLNDSMSALWNFLKSRYGSENALDVTEIDQAIRPLDVDLRPGFGIVRLPRLSQP